MTWSLLIGSKMTAATQSSIKRSVLFGLMFLSLEVYIDMLDKIIPTRFLWG